MCGGGSAVVAAVVSDASGSVDEGVEERRSVYEMNERRLAAAEWGEGGCERVAVGES